MPTVIKTISNTSGAGLQAKSSSSLVADGSVATTHTNKGEIMTKKDDFSAKVKALTLKTRAFANEDNTHVPIEIKQVLCDDLRTLEGALGLYEKAAKDQKEYPVSSIRWIEDTLEEYRKKTTQILIGYLEYQIPIWKMIRELEAEILKLIRDAQYDINWHKAHAIGVALEREASFSMSTASK